MVSFARTFLVAALVMATPHTARADGVMEIMSELKQFRAAGVALFEQAGASLKEGGFSEESAEVAKWSDDWFSIMGINTGLTGLAKDFAVNYLGRQAYHDKNGPLLDALREVPGAMKYRQKEFQGSVQNLCANGVRVFEKGGALHNMLSALEKIAKNDEIYRHFEKALKGNTEIRDAFEYLAGERPSKDDAEL